MQEVIKLLRKEHDIHFPTVGVIVRVTEEGVALLTEGVHIKSPADGVFNVDNDNWLIMPNLTGGIALHSAGPKGNKSQQHDVPHVEESA